MAFLVGGSAVALVEPCRKHGPVRIEGERLEALALAASGDRAQLGKCLSAVGGSCVEHLAVEGLVPEDRERQGDAAIARDDDLGTRIGAPIEIEPLFGDHDRLRKAMAAIA